MATYAERADLRALESNRHAMARGETWTVRSDSQPGVRHEVVRLVDVGGLLVLDCDCPGAEHHQGEPIPCKHAARVARRLGREGKAAHRAGYWWTVDEPRPRTVQPADPFDGLVAS